MQTIHRDTGEVVTAEKFDFASYLTHIGNEGLSRQQQLAVAYDKACAALIGPNDVQVEGNRSFKKKSAWRKLARHFGISTRVTQVTKEWLGNGDVSEVVFLATVTVAASSPWGQSAESVGACGTDEESGRRKITLSDAIATAETRATNRAISNLIAMGEVSAEEMSKSGNGGSKNPADKVMPFGKAKGKRLGDLHVDVLRSTVTWCVEKDGAKFADLIAACNAVIASRAVPENGEADEENWGEDGGGRGDQD
jgi:hypothetical protein